MVVPNQSCYCCCTDCCYWPRAFFLFWLPGRCSAEGLYCHGFQFSLWNTQDRPICQELGTIMDEETEVQREQMSSSRRVKAGHETRSTLFWKTIRGFVPLSKTKGNVKPIALRTQELSSYVFLIWAMKIYSLLCFTMSMLECTSFYIKFLA